MAIHLLNFANQVYTFDGGTHNDKFYSPCQSGQEADAGQP